MNAKMWFRIVALLTILIGSINFFMPGVFGPDIFQASRYLHGILGIALIGLGEMAIARSRRGL